MAVKVFRIREMRLGGTGGGGVATYLPIDGREDFAWTATNRAAPVNSWDFGLKQRTVRDDYAGSEEPSEQVLGWSYTPFTVQGGWDDKYMGAGEAWRTLQRFEALVQRGNPVEISFEQIKVYGLITDVQFRYRRKDLIGYSFTVSPHVRQPGQSVRQGGPKLRTAPDPRDVARKARAALMAAQEAQAQATAANLSQVQQALDTGLYGALQEDLAEAESLVATLEGVVESYVLGPAEKLADSASRAAQILQQAKTSAARILERTADVTSTAALSYETATTALDFECWSRGLRASALAMVLGAEEGILALRERSEPEAQHLHRARAGESLYSVSRLYYGTPHRWREIAERNGLTTLTLAGGELLVIPRA